MNGSLVGDGAGDEESVKTQVGSGSRLVTRPEAGRVRRGES